MRLHYVEIRNFRSIQEVRIDFEPRCRTLVGINESGKSNILAALALLDRGRSFERSDVRENDSDEALDQPKHVRFVFRLEPSERGLVAATSKFRVFPADRALIKKATQKFTIVDYASSVTEAIWQVDAGGGAGHASYWAIDPGYSVIDGWMRPKDPHATGEITFSNGSKKDLKDISLVHADLLKQESLEIFVPADVEYVASLVGKRVTNLVLKNLPSCVYWTYSEKNLLPSQIEIATFEADPSSCEPLRQMFVLAGINNPAEAFATYRERPHGIRNLLERVANRATKHLREVWAECGPIQISLTPNGEKIDASVKDAHNYFSIDRRSDGFKRFVSFLLLVSAKARTNQLTNTLYLQDEPDLGLHPSGIKYLLKELVDMSRENYVLVSTHSIFMVDKERIDRHILVKKKAEKTSIEEVGPSNITDEEVIYNALGYSLHEELRKNNIVFEGWRDKRLFRVYCLGKEGKQQGFNKLLNSTGVCHSKGVKDVSRVVELLELYGKTGIVVSDGDDPAIEQQRRFAADRPEDTWMRYDELARAVGKITAEDFIEPALLRKSFAAVLSEFPTLGVPSDELFEGAPVCAAVKDWLGQAGANRQQTSELMNAWKSLVFENLKARDIKQTYATVAAEIFRSFE
ncbi:MAG: hypothetical protein CL625_01035 [Arenimonas sp.]|jgi:predicted ATPase|nr:hypothetical protein [Arenimonas sp.]|tara:strand:- start:203 stop:2101 length:1899 start_codon:yes stop_codon:yes gene_type:complete